jgi:hypothetical protein
MKMNISENSGIAILLTGVFLLVVTFFFAYSHFQADVKVLSVLGIATPLDGGLALFLEAAFRLFYLSIMGWIASVVMARGLRVLWHAKIVAVHQLQQE